MSNLIIYQPKSRRLLLLLLKRGALAIVIITLLSIGVGLITVWFYIRDHFSGLVEKILKEAIDRPIQLGKVESFGFTGIRIGKTVIPPTSTDPDQIEIEAIEVGLDPVKFLFSQHLDLDVNVIQPNLLIKQDSSGRWISAKIGPLPKPPIPTDLKYIRITQARITLIPYHSSATGITFNYLNGVTYVTDNYQQFQIDLSGQQDQGKFRLSGNANLKASESLLSKLELATENINLSQINRLIPNSPLKLTDGFTTANLTLDIDSTKAIPLSVMGLAHINKVKTYIPVIPHPLQNTSGNIRFLGTKVLLEKINSLYDKIPIEINGLIDPKAGLDIKVTTNSIPIATASQTLQIKSLPPIEGEVKSNIQIKGNHLAPQITGTIINTQPITVSLLELEELNAKFKLIGKTLTTQFNTTPKLGGKITGNANINISSQTNPIFDTTIQIQELPGDRYTAKFFPEPLPIKLGNLSSTINLKGSLQNITGVIQYQAPESTYPATGELKVNTLESKLRLTTNLKIGSGQVSAIADLTQQGWKVNLQPRQVNLSALVTLPAFLQPNLFTGSLTLSSTNLDVNDITLIGSGRLTIPNGIIKTKLIQIEKGQWSAKVETNHLSPQGLIPTTLDPMIQKAIATANTELNLSGSLNQLINNPTPDLLNQINIAGRANFKLGNSVIKIPNLNVNQGNVSAIISSDSLTGSTLPLGSLVSPLIDQIRGELKIQTTLSEIQDPNVRNLIKLTGSGSIKIMGGGVLQVNQLSLEQGKYQTQIITQDLSTSHLKTLVNGNISGKFNLKGSLDNLTSINLVGSATLPLGRGKIQFNDLQVNQGNYRTNLIAQKITLTQICSQLPAAIASYCPNQPINGNINLSGSLNSLLENPLKNIQATGIIDFTNIPLLNKPLSAEFKLTEQQLNLIQVKAPDLALKGIIGLKLEKNIPSITQFDLSVISSNFNLSSLPLPVKGIAGFNGQITGTLLDPRLIGNLDLKGLTVSGLTFENLYGGINYGLRPGGMIELRGINDQINAKLDRVGRTSFVIQRGKSIAQGYTHQDTLITQLRNFPIILAKDIIKATPILQKYIPQEALSQPIGGDLSADLQVNIKNMSLIAKDLQITQPVIANLRGDLLSANLNYINGVGQITQGQFIKGKSNYELSATFNLNTDNPQLQGQIKIPQGKIQELLTGLAIFDLEDFKRGFKPVPTGSAKDLAGIVPAGLPDAPLFEQLKRFSEVSTLLEQVAQQRRTGEVIPPLDQLTGDFALTSQIHLSYQEGIKANFEFSGADWKWGPYSSKQIIGKGRFYNNIIRLEPLTLSYDESLISFSGQIGGNNQSGLLTIREIPIKPIQEILNLPLNITGLVNANAIIRGAITNPQFQGELTLIQGTINETPIQTANGNFDYNNARLNFNSSLLVQGNDPIALTGSVPYQLPFATVLPNNTELSLDINVKNQGLSLLNLLTKQQITLLGGTGQVQLKLIGNLNKEQTLINNLIAQGKLEIDNATISAIALPEPLTNISTRVDFNFDTLTVKKFQGEFAKGKISAQGSLPISIKQEIADPLKVELEKLAININGLYQGGVKGKLFIQGTAIAPEVGGAIDLFEGNVLLAEPPTQSPSNGSDLLTFRDLQIRLDQKIQVGFPPLINFLAQGSLNINGSLSEIRPSGTIQLKRGFVNLFTTQFRLASGYKNTAVFNPNQGLDPLLNIKLVASVLELSPTIVPPNPLSGDIQDIRPQRVGSLDTIRVEATVIGPISQLQNRLELNSIPSRSKAEIITLLGGGFINTLGSNNGSLPLGLASLAGSALVSPIENAIIDTFGLSEFRIFPTLITNEKNRTSSIGIVGEIGFNVTPNFSTSISKILTNEENPRINLRYRINDNLLIRGDTNFSDDTRGQIQYRLRF